MPMATACGVSGCVRGVFARGWCCAHYSKNRKYGTPLGAYVPKQRPVHVCGECGSPFRFTHSRKDNPNRGQFCSVFCRNKARRLHESVDAERHRRSVRRRACETAGARIDRRAIFLRDNWRCYLCGGETLRCIDPTRRHPAAATLDHAVPLASGGAHTPENVLTAHRGCNTLKGVRPWYEISVMML